MKDIKISVDYRSQTIKSIFSILLFLITYFVMLILAIALTVACVFGAIMMVKASPGIAVGALALGLISLGVLVLFFLLKFVFQSNKHDRSHLMEIKRTQEPMLFNMIDDIVKKVDTKSPKRVYLSSDVNASVFYDSSFWSMFLPIKKNLQIGLGLVNTTTISELEAILSHEFGHFSQRTMRVGSYVYNVNQIIFNLLYDNDGYDSFVQKWGSASGYFVFFVMIAIKIVEGIKWILIQVYGIINKTYMGLSRQMEFNADAIAASITGYKPLKESLLRMSLADHAFNSVLSFYDQKVSEKLKSQNLFRDQEFAMNFLAKENGFVVGAYFPEVDENEFDKFNKSKLVIKDQWASHPSLEDRIQKLESTGFLSEQVNNEPANTLFKDIISLQEKITSKIFSSVYKDGQVETISPIAFQSEFKLNYENEVFPKVYNGYYDNKNPSVLGYHQSNEVVKNLSLNDLFSDDNIEMIHYELSLKQDIETLKQISNGTIKVKTFDYDGIKHKKNECDHLILKLEEELQDLSEKVRNNDLRIFQYFKQLENESTEQGKLEKMYDDLVTYELDIAGSEKLYIDLSSGLDFINHTVPLEQIRENFAKVRPLERELKQEIRKILDNEIYQSELTADIKENFESYLSKDWVYLGYDAYIEKNLELLFTTINNYVYLLTRGYFLLKKQLLEYQESLIEAS